LTLKQGVKVHIPTMMTKVMELYVLPTITHYATTISAMDLWMSKMKFDTFAHIINDEWVYSCHVVKVV
jgi:hypothetical protein